MDLSMPLSPAKNVANNLVAEDYIKKNIRHQPGFPDDLKPRKTDSPFGNFPAQYRQPDFWDGNVTSKLRDRSNRNASSKMNRQTSKSRDGSLQVQGLNQHIHRRSASAGRKKTLKKSPIKAKTSYLGIPPARWPGGRAMEGFDRSHLNGSKDNASGPQNVRGRNAFGGDTLTLPPTGPSPKKEVAPGIFSGGNTPAAAVGGWVGGNNSATNATGKGNGGAFFNSERPETAGPQLSDAEMRETKRYWHTKGKFIVNPQRLVGQSRSPKASTMGSVRGAGATDTMRPISAPGYTRGRPAAHGLAGGNGRDQDGDGALVGKPLTALPSSAGPTKGRVKIVRRLSSSPSRTHYFSPAGSAPPVAGAYARRRIPPTLFRKYYERGDLPISIDHRAGGNRIKWLAEVRDLDYHVYLPVFFEGLRECDDPYRFLSVQGTVDMLEAAPHKVLPVIPQVILPIKTALETRERDIICPVLKILQQMILCNPLIGQALVPYYRQLLPIFNLFKNHEKNIGDRIDYRQRRNLDLGQLIRDTLELMESYGGPDAFINIKYMIPTYESCCM